MTSSDSGPGAPLEGVSETDARRAMQLAAAKLPIATKFATRFAEEKAS